MSDVLATFGTWQVTTEGIDSTGEDGYELSPYDIFDTSMEDGRKVWNFPIHMTQKSWLLGENDYRLDEFNQAFSFALKHFAARRPAHAHDVSDEYTYRVQKQLRAAMNRR